MVSLKYQLHGSGSRPQSIVAPHFFGNPVASTWPSTPSSSSTGIEAGSRDSPTWARGKCSRSSRATRQPLLASNVAAVLPPGPPPITTASKPSVTDISSVTPYSDTRLRCPLVDLDAVAVALCDVQPSLAVQFHRHGRPEQLLEVGRLLVRVVRVI